MKNRLDNVADLGKQFNRLSERLDNQDSVLKVIMTISHFILSIRLNLIVLFLFFQQTLNSNNYNSEKQIEKQIEKRMKKLMEKRILSIVADQVNQVNLFVIGFLSYIN